MANLSEKGKGKPISKNALYQAASSYGIEAIEILVKEMRNGDNSNARTGAAKALLNKCLPDLKAQEITGKDGEELSVYLKLTDDQLNELIASKAKEVGIA